MSSIINLNIVASANFAPAYAEVAKLNAAIANLQKMTATTGFSPAQVGSIKSANAAFDSLIRSTGAFNVRQVALTDNVVKFGKQLEAGTLHLGRYYKIWRDSARGVSAELDALATQQARLNRSISIVDPLRPGYARLVTDINGAVSATEKATFYQRALNTALRDGSVKLIDFGKNTQWAGRQLTVGLTMPIAMFGAATGVMFNNLDKELTRMMKVYGKGVEAPTTAALQSIRKQITSLGDELARAYGVPMQETARVAADLAATGQTGMKLVGATREAIRLATLGEMEYADAVQTTISLQNVYKLNTKELTESIDFLNAVENQTSTSLKDLADAIPRVGPVVAQMGGTFKDAAAMMVAMKEAGVPAAQSANAIKSLMASLINPTKAASEMFGQYGINLRKIASDNRGNGIGMLQDMQVELNKLDRLTKGQLIEKLFGKYQMARVTALIENLGKAGSQSETVFNLMGASTQELAKMSDKELKIQTESASGRFKKMVSSLQADFMPLGNFFLNTFSAIGEVISKIAQAMNWFNETFGAALKPFKILFSMGAGVALVAGPILMLVGLFSNLAGNLLKGATYFRMFRQGMAEAEPGTNRFLAGIRNMRNFFSMLDEGIVATRNQMSLMPESIMSSARAFDTLNIAIKELTAQYVMLSEAQAMSMAVPMRGGARTPVVMPRIGLNSGTSGLYVPGGSPSQGDVVPAMLTPGEAVIPADKAAKYRPLIGAMINGAVPGYNAGTPFAGIAEKNIQKYAFGAPIVMAMERMAMTAAESSAFGKWGASWVRGDYVGLAARETLAREIASDRTLASAISKGFRESPGGDPMYRFMTYRPGSVPRPGDTVDLGMLTSFAENKAGAIGLQRDWLQGKPGLEEHIRQLKMSRESLAAMQDEIRAIESMDREALISKYGDYKPVSPVGESIRPRTWRKTTRPEPSLFGVTPEEIAWEDDILRGAQARLAELKNEASLAESRIVNTQGLVEKYSTEPRMITLLTEGGAPVIKMPLSELLSTEERTVNFAEGPITLREFESLLHNAKAQVVSDDGINLTMKLLESGRLGAAAEIEQARRAPLSKMKELISNFKGKKSMYVPKGTSGIFGASVSDPSIVAKYPHLSSDGRTISWQRINKLMEPGKPGVPGEVLWASTQAARAHELGSTEVFLAELARSGIITQAELTVAKQNILREYEQAIKGRMIHDYDDPYTEISRATIKNVFKNNGAVQKLYGDYLSEVGVYTSVGSSRGGSVARRINLTINGETISIPALKGREGSTFLHSASPEEFTQRLSSGTIGVSPNIFRANTGAHIVPGIGNTDTVPALLTPGEAVIPKSQAEKYRPLISSIISDSLPGYEGGTSFAHIGQPSRTTLAESAAIFQQQTGSIPVALARLLAYGISPQASAGFYGGLGFNISQSTNSALARGGVPAAAFSREFAAGGVEKWATSMSTAGLSLDKMSADLKKYDAELLRLITATAEQNVDYRVTDAELERFHNQIIQSNVVSQELKDAMMLASGTITEWRSAISQSALAAVGLTRQGRVMMGPLGGVAPGNQAYPQQASRGRVEGGILLGVTMENVAAIAAQAAAALDAVALSLIQLLPVGEQAAAIERDLTSARAAGIPVVNEEISVERILDTTRDTTASATTSATEKEASLAATRRTGGLPIPPSAASAPLNSGIVSAINKTKAAYGESPILHPMAAPLTPSTPAVPPRIPPHILQPALAAAAGGRPITPPLPRFRLIDTSGNQFGSPAAQELTTHYKAQFASTIASVERQANASMQVAESEIQTAIAAKEEALSLQQASMAQLKGMRTVEITQAANAAAASMDPIITLTRELGLNMDGTRLKTADLSEAMTYLAGQEVTVVPGMRSTAGAIGEVAAIAETYLNPILREQGIVNLTTAEATARVIAADEAYEAELLKLRNATLAVGDADALVQGTMASATLKAEEFAASIVTLRESMTAVGTRPTTVTTTPSVVPMVGNTQHGPYNPTGWVNEPVAPYRSLWQRSKDRVRTSVSNSWASVKSAGSNMRNSRFGQWATQGWSTMGPEGQMVSRGGGMMGQMGAMMVIPMITGAAASAIGDKTPGARIGSSALNMAGMGAMVGSFIGPEGALIGALAGAAIGGITSAWSEHMDELARLEKEHQSRVKASFQASGSAVKIFENSATSALKNIAKEGDKTKGKTGGEGTSGKSTLALANRIKNLSKDDPIYKTAMLLQEIGKEKESDTETKKLLSQNRGGATTGVLRNFLVAQAVANPKMKQEDLLQMAKSQLVAAGRESLTKGETWQSLVRSLSKSLESRRAIRTERYAGLEQGTGAGVITATEYKDMTESQKRYGTALMYTMNQIGSGQIKGKELQSTLLGLKDGVKDNAKAFEALRLAALNAGNTSLAQLTAQVRSLGLEIGDVAKLSQLNTVGIDPMSLLELMPEGSDPKKWLKSKEAQKEMKRLGIESRNEQIAAINKQFAAEEKLNKQVAPYKAKLAALEKQKKAVDARLEAEQKVTEEMQRQNDLAMSQADLDQKIVEAKLTGDYLGAANLAQQKTFDAAEYNQQLIVNALQERSQEIQGKMDKLQTAVDKIQTAASETNSKATALSNVPTIAEIVKEIKTFVKLISDNSTSDTPTPKTLSQLVSEQTASPLAKIGEQKQTFQDIYTMYKQYMKGGPGGYVDRLVNGKSQGQALYSGTFDLITPDNGKTWRFMDTSGLDESEYQSWKEWSRAQLGKATGGEIRRFSTAGFVSGAGSATSDSIPAMLSNGEYVVRASAVSKYGTDFLNAVNSQRFAVGTESYTVSGDRMSSPAFGSSTENNYNINLNVESGATFDRNTVDYLVEQLKIMNAKDGRGNKVNPARGRF